MSGVTGLARFKLTRGEMRDPVWVRLQECVAEELALKREQNDHPMDIVKTTGMRGEIAMLKRILALADEVGPESRQSEPQGPSLRISG